MKEFYYEIVLAVDVEAHAVLKICSCCHWIGLCCFVDLFVSSVCGLGMLCACLCIGWSVASAAASAVVAASAVAVA